MERKQSLIRTCADKLRLDVSDPEEVVVAVGLRKKMSKVVSVVLVKAWKDRPTHNGFRRKRKG